ncbi:hypothetical protein Har1131_18890 [Haloarcula sp. CBA1131]|uniref:hypothetical protein n=1 Tax=Haloarcula sp. CBA1131 TaxID=1853686 RepID=UPI0012449BED|nr:hypothetical protein [Haloarcula sp. CBA1131]KAA9400742.1 hypothetical protein Har1131_18890 [Haloarcula sp. CBA1131]
MSDKEYAHQALSALERIETEAHDEFVCDTYERAVTAVGELATALGEGDETDDGVAVDAPEEWNDEEEWEEKIDEAYEKAEIARSKGTLTTKTIGEREYYYLQWREGEKVKSQYVAPISPA